MLQAIKTIVLGSIMVMGLSMAVISLALLSVQDAETRYSKLVK